MKNTLETRLGLFFALALVAAFLIFEMVGGANLVSGGYRLRARFNNVSELKVGDAVKMAGVQIGRVEKIDFADDKVEVTMKIKKEATVRTDARATIRFVGLMGQNYVSFNLGTPKAPKVSEGALLESGEQPDLNVLMAKLDNVASGIENVTKSFNGESFNNLLGPITDFLKENNPKISGILGNLQNMTTQMAEGKGTVGKLINDDQLYSVALSTVSNLNNTATDIKGVIARAKVIVDDVEQGKGTLGKLTKDEALYKETTTAMTNLKEILEKVNKGQGLAGKLVNDDTLYKNVKLTLQKLDKTTEGLEDQGPLSILGTAVGNLF
jgi:phospholipid/cholesterol/gamma-HCH transport system substrate-binding protein